MQTLSANDRVELESFLKEQYQALNRIAANQCRPENVELKHVSGFNAEEVTQEVCIRLFMDWSRAPSGPELFGYAKAIAHNHCCDLWAKHQRRARAFKKYQKEVAHA